MGSTPTNNKRIFIIEDEAASADFLHTLLENEGYSCTLFSNGESAITALGRGEHADLILLDIMLDGMDGYEVCKILKSDAKLRYIPVIIISGKSSVEEKVLGLRLGADDYLVKPFKNKELIAKIQVLLRIKSLQDQLIHAEKLAGIGQLAAGIAHEFNNLIGGMLGYAQLGMMNAEDREMTRKAFSVIEKSCFRAKELTENMLLFSSNRIKPEATSAIENCLSHCQILMASEFKKNSIVLSKELNHTHRVAIDPNRLLQIFVNLLRNSVQAIENSSEKQERLIRVITEDNDENVILEIQDSGCGIDEKSQERIFDPFFTTKGVLGGGTSGGSGMGLSVVYGIITSHNGTISLKESSSRGTVFEISLPAIDNPDQATGVRAGSRHVKSETVDLNGFSALIVDDEEIYQNLLEDTLSKKGMRIHKAGSGEDACQICKNEKFDIIFMDYLMPGIGGIEAARIISKIKGQGSIVYITGKAILDNLKESISSDKARFFTKPFNLNELESLIEEILPAPGR